MVAMVCGDSSSRSNDEDRMARVRVRSSNAVKADGGRRAVWDGMSATKCVKP